MTTYSNERSTLGKIVTWLFLAIFAIAALKLAFWVVGAAFGLGALLLFTLGPILLVGWLLYKLIDWLGSGSSTTY